MVLFNIDYHYLRIILVILLGRFCSGHPTILVVPQDDRSFLITPTIDSVSALAVAKVDRVVAWNDGAGNEWREELPMAVAGVAKIGIEIGKIPQMVQDYIDELAGISKIDNITPLLSKMRMIKSFKELQLARHAGEVAGAMVDARRAVIAKDVPEFEVAIATSQAGTRKAAEILSLHYCDADMSPNIHFLQNLASGKDIVKTHHRASTRIMKHGDPVFLCFCGMTNFHRFMLGFNRTFWIGEIM